MLHRCPVIQWSMWCRIHTNVEAVSLSENRGITDILTWNRVKRTYHHWPALYSHQNPMSTDHCTMENTFESAVKQRVHISLYSKCRVYRSYDSSPVYPSPHFAVSSKQRRAGDQRTATIPIHHAHPHRHRTAKTATRCPCSNGHARWSGRINVAIVNNLRGERGSICTEKR